MNELMGVFSDVWYMSIVLLKTYLTNGNGHVNIRLRKVISPSTKSFLLPIMTMKFILCT
jgi:hypothetical protein